MASRQEVLDFMKARSYSPMEPETLLAALGIEADRRQGLQRMLKRMEKEGLVVKTRSGRYGVPERMNLVVGTLQVNPKGYGFVLSEVAGKDDLYIAEEEMGGAMHGDRVIARVHRGHGSIVRVLRRENRQIVGVYEKGRPFGFLKPEQRRLVWPVGIPVEESMGARNGDRVVAEIVKWPEGRKGPRGRVIRRLGPAADAGTDFALILEKHGLTEEFPKGVLQEAQGFSAPSEDTGGRLDLRHLPLVTIDGEDARDFDDAVSLEETERGYRLGVHIADVSWYVREGSLLDREALRRGTSVYLVERAVHMLPERLSTVLASLRPDEDRLALSVFITYDREGRLLDHSLARTVIRSRKRLTYSQVEGFLESGQSGVVPFGAMERLAKMLREARQNRGALELETPEQEIVLDEKGKPLMVSLASKYRSHSIIEEFMISANELVAKVAATRGIPLLYRVHEEPDPLKMEALADFLFRIGYLSKRPRRAKARLIREALAKSKGKPEENLVSSVVLRCLKVARYDANPSPHFGLGSSHYCHFTSPIRRYPDLVVHRAVTECILGRMPRAKVINRWRRVLPEIALKCSALERIAQEAERDSTELKTLRYMKEQLGEVFHGLISGVVPYGFYVQLDNGAEGLVHVSYLTDDYYHFVEDSYSLVGERTKKRYRLGDRVQVRVVAVDIQERTMEMRLEDVSSKRHP